MLLARPCAASHRLCGSAASPLALDRVETSQAVAPVLRGGHRSGGGNSGGLFAGDGGRSSGPRSRGQPTRRVHTQRAQPGCAHCVRIQPRHPWRGQPASSQRRYARTRPRGTWSGASYASRCPGRSRGAFSRRTISRRSRATRLATGAASGCPRRAWSLPRWLPGPRCSAGGATWGAGCRPGCVVRGSPCGIRWSSRLGGFPWTGLGLRTPGIGAHSESHAVAQKDVVRQACGAPTLAHFQLCRGARAGLAFGVQGLVYDALSCVCGLCDHAWLPVPQSQFSLPGASKGDSSGKQHAAET